MDNGEKKPELTQASFDEAPASVTVKIKSPGGYEYMFTMRDAKASTLMFKMKAMEANWTQQGFTPLAQNVKSGFPKKEPEYVPNRQCPTCGSRLVKAQTRDGRKLVKCETNKWNMQLKRAEGCPFTEWEQAQQPRQTYGEHYEETKEGTRSYGDY